MGLGDKSSMSVSLCIMRDVPHNVNELVENDAIPADSHDFE
jgi:hypothetical protein